MLARVPTTRSSRRTRPRGLVQRYYHSNNNEAGAHGTRVNDDRPKCARARVFASRVALLLNTTTDGDGRNGTAEGRGEGRKIIMSRRFECTGYYTAAAGGGNGRPVAG